MRLLQFDDDRGFSLTEFAEDEIPRYAILSHTWGPDRDEVTYEDILNGTRSGKAGFDKLHFCTVQAKKDGLGYCWIDTCCINKTNAAELTESINSMFRWYQNAVKCYVFLADVSTPMREDDRDSQLRNSRWFTRGWTLQELIAPQCVEFFSQNGERLGDRKSLGKQIHQITGISIHALQGEPLSHFTIDERMSWAVNRMTKRPEDKVYSLLGIFDIHMEAIYGEGEHHASQRLQRELERYSENHQLSELFRKQLQLSAKQPKTPLVHPKWIVPFERNPRFVGRESELTRLEGMLFGKKRAPKLAITGLGGVGKTQLILELLYHVVDKQKHHLIIWISAVNMESLHQSYLDVARQLGIPGLENEKMDVKKLVQEYLSKDEAGQWLLVFDNADDVEMWMATPVSGQSTGQPRCLIDCVPRSKHGSVVFTTRDRKTAGKLAPHSVVELPEMSNAVSVKLLGNCLPDLDFAKQKQDAVSLVAKLTNLPLAIVQAAAYISENSITLAEYLSLLSQQEEEVVDLLSENFEDDGRYRDVNNPVATTWLISFGQIRRRDPLAADYLSFMACVEPEGIPQSLLPPGASRKKETDAIGTLNAYSFINKRPADQCLDLHRLVHLATRNWLRKEELLITWTHKAITRLGEVFPNHEHENRMVWRKYLAHAGYALESSLTREDDEDRNALLWRLGMCIYQDGRWDEAEKAFSHVMETRKRVLGAEHPSTLASMANLASTYRDKGRWDEAEELEVQVMETRKRVLEPEHPDMLANMANLASTFWNKGRWDEAEELFMQVMETTKRRVLGPEHPDTLTSMANLASTYRNKGRWDEAEELEVQVMETRKRVLGPEHPSTLTSMNNLAITWKAIGRQAEALKLMDECVQLNKQVVGVCHPHFLSSSTTLSAWRLGD
ncbi:HET-domain-containing protein [Lepidopterella palustris CBS 459.81]|uniref:HET-domain-containing protein n=1 Tax=Lepidopterella palustris CBS 459.81 TaxID=1314670 RepID=A0A8E2JJN9_9PEZI|nr:HET-domain-containing protein [Lepidopterella palustris CBS 459.81]